VTCNAVDAAGNHATPKTFKVNVLYNWNGFFQPVDNSMWNSAKAGQSIPVKFSLGGNMGLDIFGTWGSPAKSYPKITAIACPSASISIDAIEEYATSTANNGLVYDATAGQYNYVWKTEKSWATKCFQFDLGLKDGSIHTFKVQFSK
jgi:hypothetical protein